jgi:hypothetical protein
MKIFEYFANLVSHSLVFLYAILLFSALNIFQYIFVEGRLTANRRPGFLWPRCVTLDKFLDYFLPRFPH